MNRLFVLIAVLATVVLLSGVGCTYRLYYVLPLKMAERSWCYRTFQTVSPGVAPVQWSGYVPCDSKNPTSYQVSTPTGVIEGQVIVK